MASRHVCIAELDGILESHRKWLHGEKGGERADLRDSDLSGADLSYADLRGADLRADLRDADLSRADLRAADLRADLSRADLRAADLRGADLRDGDLSYADLRGGEGVEMAAACVSICPEGALIGWKKCMLRADADGEMQRPCIVKLRIPEDAARSNATGRRCRAARAEVLAVETVDGAPLDETAYSEYDGGFSYTVGATVEPTRPFDPCRWNVCTSGIHFYITRLEAVNN